MRTVSAISPPHGPQDGPNPNAASAPSARSHVDVRPRTQRGQLPQDTAHGTTTCCPTRSPVTSDPSSTTSATHSCPIGNGPRNGTDPQIRPTAGSTSPSTNPACSARETGRWIGSVSPSHRPARNGRTSASVGSCNRGAARSCQRSRPARSNLSSRSAITVVIGGYYDDCHGHEEPPHA